MNNKIDALAKVLKDFKEEFTKNVNGSYESQPNIKKIASKIKAEASDLADMHKSGEMSMIKYDKNGQWSLDKADAKAKAEPKAKVKASADEAAPAPAPAPVAAAPAPVAAAPAPVAAAPAPTAGSSGNSPTKTNTETGGSSPGGASTGGVGSGLGGAGTGGAATGGASTGGAGTVTVTISGSSSTETSTETSSGAGAKKGKGKDKGKGGEPAAPITLNISNVGGRTDAGNVASGDGPGASGSGGHAPNGFGGGGGGASPDEPANFSTASKDKPAKDADKNDVFKVDKNGQWSLDKSASANPKFAAKEVKIK